MDRRALADELLGLVAVAGWQHRLGDPGAARSYARLVEVAAVLGFPAPPPVQELAADGVARPADVWLARCGLG